MCLKKDGLSRDEQDFIRKIDIKKYKHKNDNKNINSDLIPVLLNLQARSLNIMVKLNLVSSLGWNDNPLIVFHALAPLITFPNTRT